MKTNPIELGIKVLKTEAQAIDALCAKMDESFTQAIELILSCKSRVIFTGMGKPGLIARKISATFASTGIPSLYLHPAEAIHGDLGMVTPQDVVIAISNSGETEEITKLLPLIKKLGTPLIGMVGNITSTLAKYSNVVLDVSVEKEACPLGIVPTSSTTAVLAMGDALAVCLIEMRGFKREDFAFYHPGGSLGRQLLLKTSDIMRPVKDLALVQTTTCIGDVLLEVTKTKSGCALICDAEEKLLGIFTDGDLRRALEKDPQITKSEVAEHMTRNPVTIRPDTLAAEALRIIKDKKIDEIPVTDESGVPLGLVDEKDLLGLE